MVEETVDMVTNPKVTEFPQALPVKWWRVWLTELVPVSSQNTRRHQGESVQASQQMLGCVTKNKKQCKAIFFFSLLQRPQQASLLDNMRETRDLRHVGHIHGAAPDCRGNVNEQRLAKPKQ